jgi:hypothetical protein
MRHEVKSANAKDARDWAGQAVVVQGPSGFVSLCQTIKVLAYAKHEWKSSKDQHPSSNIPGCGDHGDNHTTKCPLRGQSLSRRDKLHLGESMDRARKMPRHFTFDSRGHLV